MVLRWFWIWVAVGFDRSLNTFPFLLQGCVDRIAAGPDAFIYIFFKWLLIVWEMNPFQ